MTTPPQDSRVTPPAGGTSPRRVVLTRPEGRQTELAQTLKQHGCDVLELPALVISPIMPEEQSELSVTEWQPEGFEAVVWVSRGAWQHYANHYARPDRHHNEHHDEHRHLKAALTGSVPLLGCVGIATARQIASDLQVPLEHILFPSGELSSDSEGLWALLKPRLKPGARVLIVRGQQGRQWLSDTLRAHGMLVTCLSVYRRTPNTWTADQVEALCAGIKPPNQTQPQPQFQHQTNRRDGLNSGTWLITSAEGLDAIAAQFDHHGLTGKEGLRPHAVVVVHERLVEPVRQWLGQWLGQGLDQGLNQGERSPASDHQTAVPIRVATPDDESIAQALRAISA